EVSSRYNPEDTAMTRAGFACLFNSKLFQLITKPALVIAVSSGLYLLLTSTFFPLDFLSTLDAKRILQLILFSTTLIFALAWTPLRTSTIAQLNRLSTLSRSALALFFLIGIVSSLRLEHPAYALVDVSMMFTMMILIAVMAASRDLSGRLFDKWSALLLALMGLAVSIQESMGYVSGWAFGSEFNYTQALLHFAHPRFYNQLQTWSIPVLAALPILFSNKKWIKLVCIALLGLQWFIVIAMAARGSIVSLFTAMAFVALFLPDLRRYWLKYQLAGLLTGIIIYSGVLFLNGVFIPQSESNEFYAHSVGRPVAHTSGRSTFWGLSTEDAIANPIIGTGPTRYACDYDNWVPAHPHSFIFRILGEWGFVALLLVLFLAVTIGLKFLERLKHPRKFCQLDSPLAAITAISLIAGVLHACLSGLLIMPASQVLMILIAGWALSLSGNLKLQLHDSTITSTLLVASVLFSCATLVFAIREVPILAERTSYSKDYGPLTPRFWQSGKACEYTYMLSTLDSAHP
ncbi:O-antigen ligase family protein, partial [Pseudomonadota bacterium]